MIVEFKMQRSSFNMPPRSTFAAVVCAWCLVNVAVLARASSQGYGLGRPATADEIRRLDVLIPPSGAGLPAGSGTAETGKAVYAAQCARCHGATGREGPEDVLVGGIGSLGTARPLKTVGSYWPYATTLWDYVNRAMPFDRPGVLPPDDVYAVVAYMLQLNGIISTTDVVDQTTLPKVRMPNRDGFVPDARPAVGGRESAVGNRRSAIGSRRSAIGSRESAVGPSTVPRRD